MYNAARVELAQIELNQAFWYRLAKRLFDLTGAALLLVCLSPVFLVCALLVRFSSPGPILFRQQRVGARGREFTFLKFRSMRVDADPALHREYVARFINGAAEQQAGANGSMYKLVHDPRVTPVGRWLRRTSLDELPQLINVLRGEMSLVGPRPPIPYELEHYRPEHLRRLAVKPGITGLWQISGRSHTTFEEMVALDLEYIQRASFMTDLGILLRTVPVVLAQHGVQ
ncbi:MAG TPA: sugar transferase [Thermomicrobiales bacterium]|nr:sugar transferase [Thermomicrobiales bacterium]